MGILSFQTVLVSVGIKFEISVAMYPGETVLARANLTHSTASDLPALGISTMQVYFSKAASLTEMDNGRFGGIVCCLHLREVDNVTAHGSGGHKAAIGEVVKCVTVDIGTLLLLSPPVGCCRPGAVKGTVQIDIDHILVVVQRTVNHGTLSPGNTGIGNENVQSAVEVFHNLVNGLLHGFGLGDFDLVRLGWNEH